MSLDRRGSSTSAEEIQQETKYRRVYDEETGVITEEVLHGGQWFSTGVEEIPVLDAISGQEGGAEGGAEGSGESSGEESGEVGEEPGGEEEEILEPEE